MIVHGDFLLTRERSSEGTDPPSHYLIHRIDFVSALGSATPSWASTAPSELKRKLLQPQHLQNVLPTSKPGLFSSVLFGLTFESHSPEAFNISLPTLGHTILKLETKHQSQQKNNLMAFLWQNLEADAIN